MEKASFKAEVERNQLLDMFSPYLLLSYTSYQSKEEEIGVGRAVQSESRNPNVVSVSVSLKSHQVSYLKTHVCCLFHHSTALSFPVAVSAPQYFTPWSHRLYTYSFPFYSRVFFIKANPPRLSHQTCSNQVEQRRKNGGASEGSQSKLSSHTWRKRTSFHMQRAAPFSTAVSKIGINY